MTHLGFRSPFSFLLDDDASPSLSEDVGAVLTANDVRFFGEALDQACGAMGRTTPNPPVGAIVVAPNGDVVGRGQTQPVGGHHAEVMALNDAGSLANGSTVYVTLEPCSHQGRTPPCTDALIASNVAKVVIATRDPNPRVDGQGETNLRNAGITVVNVPAGEIATRAKALSLPFASTLKRKRPWTVAKVATTLDGKVATATGNSRWVTGPQSRALVHQLRNRVDVIVVGRGTVNQDDPELTVRDLAHYRNPRRVVVDGALATATTAKVYQSSTLDASRALVAHHNGADDDVRMHFDRAGIDRFEVGETAVDLSRLWRKLAEDGATSALVEPGPRLFAALIAAELVDEVWWMTAPKIVGGDGISAVGALDIEHMNRAFSIAGGTHPIGADTLTIGAFSTPD